MTDNSSVPAVPMAPTAKAVHDAFVEHAIDQFLVTANGILVAAEDGDIPVTAGYANVRATARDGAGDRWSLVLDWKNQDGDLRTLIIPYARIVGDWSAVMVQLADQGLVVSPKFWGAFRDFLTYAVGTPTIPRYRLLPKIGFFPVDRKNPNGAFGFLWPDEPVVPEGATMEPVLFMPPLPSPVQGAYRAHGDHEEWLQKSQHLANDDLWVVMTCAGFASLLLEASGLECFGFHIIANTTNGKTTRARAAVGVVGCPALPSESNGEALCSNWTATTNGIELLAIAHSGGPMLLDELGAMPQGVVPNVYGLMQGRSKARMADVGAMRQQYSWKILAVSTGEISLTERLAQEGQRKAMGGELVRLMELHLDHMRPIESLTQEQADARGAYMKQLLADHYGTPGRHFVRALVGEFPDYASLCEALREDVDAAHDGLVDELSRQRPLSPVLRRGLRQFALLRVAGAWAHSAGASPFDGEVVERAVLTTAAAWVDGFAETTDEQRLIASLRAYVFEKQDSFIDCDTADRLAVEAEEWVPGLFHHDGKLWFEPSEFEAACNGIPAKQAGKLLAELGILHRHVGDAQHKTKVTIWPWVFHHARYYAVYANRILSAEELAELCAGSAG